MKSDRDTAAAIAADPFHSGLAEFGEFKGFDKRREPGPVNAMSDEEIERSKARVARLLSKTNVGLVLAYFGILGLMVRAYS